MRDSSRTRSYSPHGPLCSRHNCHMDRWRQRRTVCPWRTCSLFVFKALLNFIYTDALPDFFDDLDEENYSKHLLAAADIYTMDRLKFLCGSILIKHLRVETVATTLAIADQHNCESLKQICIEFMASSDKMDAVVATQGYANLKRTCPSILVDVLEKRSRCHKA